MPRICCSRWIVFPRILLPGKHLFAACRSNITEVNEREITAALDSKITALTDSVTDSELKLIRDDLYRIMELNMASIHMKSSDTAVSATDAMWSLAIVSALCALLAMIFLIRFPAIVLRPIDKLKQGGAVVQRHGRQTRRIPSQFAR